MKKFLEDLYDYYLNNHPIPEIYINEEGKPRTRNAYVDAILYNFQGIIVPSRRSDLEEIAYSVCKILDQLYYAKEESPYPSDKDSIKLYQALCCCLAYVDYEAARYSYDYNTNYDLNTFDTICKNFGINYTRIIYCCNDWILESKRTSGFRKEYLDMLIQDENLEKGIVMSYCDNILINMWSDQKFTVYKIEDWIKDPDIKKVWNKLPFEYIRDNYRDDYYYDTLSRNGQLPLLAMCIEAVNVECEDELGKRLNYARIEKALMVKRFINQKLSESCKFVFLDNPDLDVSDMIAEFMEARPKVKELCRVFPGYRAVIKTRLEKQRRNNSK